MEYVPSSSGSPAAAKFLPVWCKRYRVLRPFHRFIRKSQLGQPKFYFFDLGAQRYLAGTLAQALLPGTGAFGDAFESFLVQECLRLNSYFEGDFRPSFLRTKHGAEIDLILSKGSRHIGIEIKSSDRIDPVEVRAFSELGSDLPGKVELYYLSRDESSQELGKVRCWPYQRFLEAFKEMIG